MAYICQHCGHKSNTAMAGSCTYSPTEHHVYIEEHDGGYVCQHCGHKSNTAMAGSCTHSPTKHHVYI